MPRDHLVVLLPGIDSSVLAEPDALEEPVRAAGRRRRARPADPPRRARHQPGVAPGRSDPGLGLSRATAYRYHAEGANALTAKAPDLAEALQRVTGCGRVFSPLLVMLGLSGKRRTDRLTLDLAELGDADVVRAVGGGGPDARRDRGHRGAHAAMADVAASLAGDSEPAPSTHAPTETDPAEAGPDNPTDGPSGGRSAPGASPGDVPGGASGEAAWDEFTATTSDVLTAAHTYLDTARPHAFTYLAPPSAQPWPRLRAWSQPAVAAPISSQAA